MVHVRRRTSQTESVDGEGVKCGGCGALNCAYLWPEQKKCCPDCTHSALMRVTEREYNVITKGEWRGMQSSKKERLVHELAAAVDVNDPPGLAAYRLARAVVTLIAGRESSEAYRLAKDLEDLSAEYERPLVKGRDE